MGNIVVHLADPHWTIQALHLASALARNTHSRVTLLHLMLARNPGLLGSELATPLPTWQERERFFEYEAVCEDYGVECVLQPMQYVSFTEALQDAAIVLNADAFFVKMPEGRFKYWNRFCHWRLKRAMRIAGCHLYVVDVNTRMIEWSPLHTKPTDAGTLPPTEKELVSLTLGD